jgi:hypothetical protein
MRKIEMLTHEATKTTTDKGQQNTRRHQAMNDPYNYFALVIMLMVVYSKGDIDPRLSFNTDKSSSLLNDDTNMVILTAFGVKDELSEMNRNVTTTKQNKAEHKRRGISYSALSSSDGNLSSFTIHIKDTGFNNDGKVTTYELKPGKLFLQTLPVSTKYSAGLSLSSSEHSPLIDNDVADDAGDEDDEDDTETLTYAEQEALQYITQVVIPVMEKCRTEAIEMDLRAKNPQGIGSEVDQMSTEDHITLVSELAKTKKYRMLLTMDGEREHVKVVHKILGTEKVILRSNLDFPDELVVGENIDDRTGSASTLKRSFELMNTLSAHSIDQEQAEEVHKEMWRQRILNLNTEFLKLSASCSKTLQPSDVMSGFLNIHQFLNGAQFRKFDPFKMHPPAEWEMVETILKHVPVASREAFKRFY